MLDLLHFAIREAESLGARDAEVYGTRSNESEIFIENNDLKQAKSQMSESIGIRIFLRGGSSGFYSINTLNKTKVAKAVESAVRIAKVSPKDRNNHLPTSTRPVRLIRGIYDKESASFQAEDAAKMALEMLQTARSADPRVSVDSGNFSSSSGTQSIANSNGLAFSERISVFHWSIMGMAIEQGEVSNFDVQSEGSHFVKKINVSRVAEDFAQTVIHSLRPQKSESFKGHMVLSPAAASEIIGDVIAHSVNAESVQRKSSAFAGKLNHKVASELLSVYDDATNTEGLAAASFDREGVEHKCHNLIEKGVLRKFLYNTYTAKKDRVRTTANAGGSATSPPSVSITNLVVAPGGICLDDMILEIRRGILVNRFSGNVNAVTGDFSGVVKGGRLISNGHLGNAVKEVMVAGNIFESLGRLSAISRERKVIYNMIMPYMRFEDCSFTAG